MTTALACTTVCTNEGERLHTLPPCPTLGEPQCLSCGMMTNKQLYLHCIIIIITITATTYVYEATFLSASEACKTVFCSAPALTPSLPWRYLKTTNKSVKFEKVIPFFFSFFASACQRIFIKTHWTESRRVIAQENIPFWGTLVHLSPRKVYRLGKWRG